MDLSQMNEIAGTGFFFSRLPSGEISFARMSEGSDPQSMDIDSFAQTFGQEVQSEDARIEAQNILQEFNKTRRQNFTLAEFQPRDMQQDQQELRQTPEQAQDSGLLGQFMGGI